MHQLDPKCIKKRATFEYRSRVFVGKVVYKQKKKINPTSQENQHVTRYAQNLKNKIKKYSNHKYRTIDKLYE